MGHPAIGVSEVGILGIEEHADTYSIEPPAQCRRSGTIADNNVGRELGIAPSAPLAE
jgi:hypothetical protein